MIDLCELDCRFSPSSVNALSHDARIAPRFGDATAALSAVLLGGTAATIAIYADDRDAAARCRAYLPVSAAIVPTVSWEAMRAVAPFASCAILVLPKIGEAEFIGKL